MTYTLSYSNTELNVFAEDLFFLQYINILIILQYTKHALIKNINATLIKIVNNTWQLYGC